MKGRYRGTSHPIVLVGFMGSGKSTVGRRLAKLLDRPFVDLDRVIRREAGRSVRALFRELGEPTFRRLESDALRQALRTGAVVATGGGVVHSAANRSLLRQGSTVVWLDASLPVCLDRAGPADRPLLDRDPRQVRELYRVRRQWYSKADLHVRSDRGDVEAVARRIVRRLQEEPVRARPRGPDGTTGPTPG